MTSSRIIRKISKEEFDEIIRRYRNNILVSPDALFRLSAGQRKVFKEESLINILTKENPRLVGLQENERYAAFFRRNDGFIRIIFTIENKKSLIIITFVITDYLPVIKNGKLAEKFECERKRRILL